MSHSSSEKAYMRALLQCREGYSVWVAIKQVRLMLLVRVGILLLGVLMASDDDYYRPPGLLLIGFAGGALFNFFRMTFAQRRLWPVFRNVIDWEKLEELSEAQEAVIEAVGNPPKGEQAAPSDGDKPSN